MILIVDSGSTKADWRLLAADGSHQTFHTRGFNPFLHSSTLIETSLRELLLPQLPLQEIKKIFYYGAGCSDAYRCSIVEEALQRLFPDIQVHVDHDLLAAARALCGHEPGIACILGTGSNSCQYDGKVLTDHITNLGHILGDEGSGYHLGKLLIRSYFYREMPTDIREAFEVFYPHGERAILNQIYGNDKANVFLSSFAKFIAAHKKNDYIKMLAAQAFTEFLDRHVCKYEKHTEWPICFIGSIAFHFQDILKVVLEMKGMKLGNIIQKPIEKLTAFHFEKEAKAVGEQS
ncbi:MAG: hypothetical protein AAGG75_18270 [Bacteroidota bacterium]